MVLWIKSGYFLLVYKLHFRLITMRRKFTYRKLSYVLFFFRRRKEPCALFWARAEVNRRQKLNHVDMRS